MASVFGHALVGFTLSNVLDKRKTKVLLMLTMISAILSDFDVISFKLGYAYQHWLGHRGFLIP